MITPESLRDALRILMHVEVGDDFEFVETLRDPHCLSMQERLGFAALLATGDLDFADFLLITEGAGDSKEEVLERMREIWDAAYPAVTPEAALADPTLLGVGLQPRAARRGYRVVTVPSPAEPISGKAAP